VICQKTIWALDHNNYGKGLAAFRHKEIKKYACILLFLYSALYSTAASDEDIIEMCEYKKPSHRHGEHRLGDDQQFWPSTEIFRYIQRRQNGHHVGYYPRRLMSQFVARQLPGLLSEKEYALGDINKIFASHWASDRQVAFGTKCNKVGLNQLISKRHVHF